MAGATKRKRAPIDRADVLARFKEAGYDPLERALEMAAKACAEGNHDEEREWIRFLMPFGYSRKRSETVSVSVTHDLTERYAEARARALARAREPERPLPRIIDGECEEVAPATPPARYDA